MKTRAIPLIFILVFTTLTNIVSCTTKKKAVTSKDYERESSDDKSSTGYLIENGFLIPEGYELQMLEPLGGKIVKPNGWFYDGGMTENGFAWTISKEDPSKGPYDTGLKISGIVDVSKRTGLIAEEFVKSLLDTRKDEAKIISECEPTEQDHFFRICLETEEELIRDNTLRKFHIIYSDFWSNGLDMAIITVFGAPIDEWEEVKSISEIMSEFEFIDIE
jgi:hypothetical protein